MEHITLRIKLGNDAMKDADDVAHKLIETGERVAQLGALEGLGLNIRDGNGNTVGRIEYSRGDDD